MKNQFFYTRKERVAKPSVNGESQPDEFKDYLDSFSLELVARSMDLGKGRLVVLNDFHEEVRDVPNYNKSGKPVGYKKERNTYCSEIMLNEEDSKRFVEMLS